MLTGVFQGRGGGRWVGQGGLRRRVGVGLWVSKSEVIVMTDDVIHTSLALV